MEVECGIIQFLEHVLVGVVVAFVAAVIWRMLRKQTHAALRGTVELGFIEGALMFLIVCYRLVHP
jgi:hypothetical protein